MGPAGEEDLPLSSLGAGLARERGLEGWVPAHCSVWGLTTLFHGPSAHCHQMPSGCHVSFTRHVSWETAPARCSWGHGPVGPEGKSTGKESVKTTAQVPASAPPSQDPLLASES